MHGIISVHFHLRRSESGQKLTKFDPKSWNQKESVQESIQESKGIGFSSQHQPPEPKNPRCDLSRDVLFDSLTKFSLKGYFRKGSV